MKQTQVAALLQVQLAAMEKVQAAALVQLATTEQVQVASMDQIQEALLVQVQVPTLKVEALVQVQLTTLCQVQVEQIQIATNKVEIMMEDQHQEYPMVKQEEILRELEMRYCVNCFESTVSEQFWILDVGQVEHHLGLEPRPLKQTVTMDHRQEDHNQEFLQIQTAIQTHLVIKI